MSQSINIHRRQHETPADFAGRRLRWPTMTADERRADRTAYLTLHPRVVSEAERAANAARIAATPPSPPTLTKSAQAKRTKAAARRRLAEIAAERAVAARHAQQRAKHDRKIFQQQEENRT